MKAARNAPSKSRTPAGGKTPNAAPVEERGKAPDATSADVEVLSGKWSEFLTHMTQANSMVASLLHGSVARSAGGSMVEIVFPKGHTFQMEQVRDGDNRSTLEGAMKNFFAATPRLKMVTGRHTADGEGRKREELKKDPRINRILSMLDGEIVG